MDFRTLARAARIRQGTSASLAAARKGVPSAAHEHKQQPFLTRTRTLTPIVLTLATVKQVSARAFQSGGYHGNASGDEGRAVARWVSDRSDACNQGHLAGQSQ